MAVTCPADRGVVACHSGPELVHFSQIRGIEGYRELTPGGPVEFEWQDDFGQDGCQLKASFHVGTAAIGLANIPIGVGQFVAFFVMLQADRVGRRPILLWSILGYTVFTTLTAVSWSLWSFAAFQFGAQLFIGTEFGVAVTLLAEEVPSEQRGRYLSWLLLVSPLGAVLGGLLVAVGFLHNPLGWRAFFLIAAIPLLVVSVARRRLQESRAYVHMARRRGEQLTRTIHQRLIAASTIWRGQDRGHAAAVAAIAFFQGLVSAGAIGWWTYYAEHERHFGTTTAEALFPPARPCSASVAMRWPGT